MQLPKVRHVRQVYDQPTVADIPATVRAEILRSKLRERVVPGGRVAVAAGSRGIANLAVIVRAAVAAIRELGFQPFVVAGMGSHGGGTSEGQRQILADYGVTEDFVGARIVTDMDVVQIGVNELGFPVYWDKNAFAADAVVAINRIKAHTDFMGPIESGVLKMLAIGLGKRESPAQIHAMGSPGLTTMVPASARVVLAKTRFALGIAIVENAQENTAIIEAVEPEDLFAREPVLLNQAKEIMGRLPFDAADVLIVGELGKNYSGTGLDTNVIGRRLLENSSDFPRPVITRIAILDLSPETHGNASGIGLGDITTDRAYRAIDHEAMRLNTITACTLHRSKIPFWYPTDLEVFEKSFATCWQADPARIRMAIIANTLELEDIYVTDPLARELIERGVRLEVGELIDLPFAGDRLDQPKLFPHARVSRRQIAK